MEALRGANSAFREEGLFSHIIASFPCDSFKAASQLFKARWESSEQVCVQQQWRLLS